MAVPGDVPYRKRGSYAHIISPDFKILQAMETDETDTMSETNKEDAGESLNKSEVVDDISEVNDVVATF